MNSAAAIQTAVERAWSIAVAQDCKAMWFQVRGYLAACSAIRPEARSTYQFLGDVALARAAATRLINLRLHG